MSATALMVLSQGPNTASGGVALIGTLSDGAVNVANDNNTDVISWSIELVDVPPGSALTTGVLNSAVSSTPNATFTPDVPGSYRLKLTVNGTLGETDIDIRVFAIPLPGKKFIMPPYQLLPDPLPVLGSGIPGEKPNETNFSSQARGWMGDTDLNRRLLHQLIIEVNDLLGLPDLTSAADGDVPTVTAYPYQEPIYVVPDVATAFVLSSNFSTTGDPLIFPHLTGVDPDDNGPTFDIQFGLSNEQATCADWDGSQYIWLGTVDNAGNGQVRRFTPPAPPSVPAVVGSATAFNAGQGATALSYGDNYIWAGDGSNLTRIDPTTPATQIVVSGLSSPQVSAVAVDEDTTNYGDVRPRVWLVDQLLPGLRRVENTTQAQDASLLIAGTSTMKGLTVGGGFVWAVSKDSGNFNHATVYRFIPDPAALSSFNDDIEGTFNGNGGGDVYDIIYDPVTAHLYVFGVNAAGDAQISKVHPTTLLEVASLSLTTGVVVSAGGPPPRMRLFKNALWVPVMGTGGVGAAYRVDPSTLTVAQLEVYRSVAFAAAGGGVLAGDVTGPSGTNVVERIRGNNVLAGVPSADGQVYAWRVSAVRFQARNLGPSDLAYNIVPVSATPHALATNEATLAVKTTTIGGPSVINLAVLVNSREVIIYDDEGSAAVNPITVNAPGGHNINGGASVVISSNYGGLRLLYDGTVNWRIV